MDRGASNINEADFLTTDPVVTRVLDQARIVAPTSTPVLIRGESGTGKGILAQAIHSWSARARGPFVTVSCPSLSAELLESELFGHAVGAFTGAIRDVSGKVTAAEGGTLFLDEIGELPLMLQPKLLRFLQDRTYERVGETEPRVARVRVLAATNRDLDSSIVAGHFREDLLHRINSVELTMPPLRRRTDLLDLADRLLAHHAHRVDAQLRGFTAEAREALARYRWPGNLRELHNVIERAVILATEPYVGLADFPERVARAREATNGPIEVGLRVTLKELEHEHIRRLLADTGSVAEAAEVLGIDRSTLYRKRREYGL
jgi:NtrC-family two-component system response regulator AlgB